MLALALLAPSALGAAVVHGGGFEQLFPPHWVDMLSKRLSCSGDEQYCGDICIASADECCDHSYYCAGGYTCGHGGECCQDGDCDTTGTYVYGTFKLSRGEVSPDRRRAWGRN